MLIGHELAVRRNPANGLLPEHHPVCLVIQVIENLARGHIKSPLSWFFSLSARQGLQIPHFTA
jgi:hypothetical protein